MSVFHQAKYHLTYLLEAVNRHSLHTPFIYDFYTKVIRSEELNGDFSEIEELRNSLLQDKRIIEIKELGAGSRKSKTTERSIQQIAKHSLSTRQYSALLYRMIKYFNMRNIVELGTSFGINSLYLAKREATLITTFEGVQPIAKIAQQNFDKLEASNIELRLGNINKTLPLFLNGSKHPDLIYIDANHTYQATKEYFSSVIHNRHDMTIAIFDDIKWSKGMQRAWREIVAHKEVTLSIDLNKWGIVFFRPEFTKEHYVLAF